MLARWLQKLWETRSLHLHNLLYNSSEHLRLSTDMLQELLVIEEKMISAGEGGIPVSTLPCHLADSIARLKSMQLLGVDCKEDRILISFEPLFAQLLHSQLGEIGALNQYVQMYEEIQEETRRLEEVRHRQVMERVQLDEERKTLREREERFEEREKRLEAWESELLQWQKVLREKEQSFHQTQFECLAEKKRLQEVHQQIAKEKQDLENWRRELEDLHRHLDQQAGALSGTGGGTGRSYGDEIAAAEEEFRQIAQFLEQLRGTAANKEEIREIQRLQQRYRWSTDFALAFVEVAAKHNYRSVTKYRIQADLVAQRGIDTGEKLEAFFQKKSYLDEKISEVWNTLGSSIKINEHFEDIYLKWSKTWGFSHEVILRACQEAYKGTSYPSLNYVDSILTRWRQAGVRTVGDGEREIEKFKQERARNRGTRQQSPSNKGPLAGVNVMPKNEEEAKAYERFKHI